MDAQETPDKPAYSREGSLARYVELRDRRHRDRRAKSLAYGALALISCAVIVVAGVGLYLSHLNAQLAPKDQKVVDVLEELGASVDEEPFYMLLLGVDKGEERYGTEGTDPSNYRSDTIMLCRVDPGNVKATIVSIHRDLLAELPDGTYGKINSTYSMGGAAAMVEQISKLAGVPIHHYAEIDFDSFMKTVDALGGVEVTLPVDVHDPEYTGIDLSAGTHVLNGHDALMLSRARHAYDAYGDGDLFRAANQRAVIASIVRKVLASDPATMLATVSSMAEGVTTDMSVDQIVALAAAMHTFDPEKDLYQAMTPTAPEVINGAYLEILDEELWSSMMDRFRQGLPPFDSEDEDKTAGIAGTMGAEDAEVEDTGTDTAAADEGQDGPGQEPAAGAPSDAEAALDAVDKSGAVLVLGINNGTAYDASARLVEHGFASQAWEDPSYWVNAGVVVYANPAHAAEAEAIAAYLGPDFTAMQNDGSYAMFSDIVIWVRSY